MATGYTYNVTAVARVATSLAAPPVHLSDGTPIFMTESGNQTNYFVAVSKDRLGAAPILGAGNTTYLTGFTLQASDTAFGMCVDANDNIFVIGTGTTTGGLMIQSFTKLATTGIGSPYLYSAGPVIQTPAINSATVNSIGAVWCNTGGGTSNRGHLFIVTTNTIANQSSYVVVDVGAVVNGSGAFVVANGTNPNFLANSLGTSIGNLAVSQDGFGATSGICSMPSTTTNLVVGAWAINSTGTLTTNTNITTTFVTSTLGAQSSRCRLIRTAPNTWALIAPSSTTPNWKVARYSATAQTTAPVDSGTIANMNNINGPSTLGWDAFADTTTNKVWIVSYNNSSQLYRLGVTMSSGVAFDAAATTGSALPFSQSYVNVMSGVQQPVVPLDDIFYTYYNSPGGQYGIGSNWENVAPMIVPTATPPFEQISTGTNVTVGVTDAAASGTDSVLFEFSKDITFASGVFSYTATAQNAPLTNATFTCNPITQGLIPANIGDQWYWRARISTTNSGFTTYNTSKSSFLVFRGHQFVDLISTSTYDRLSPIQNDRVILSDGTPVWLENNSTSVSIVGSNDRGSSFTIAQNLGFGYSTSGTNLLVDGSDNLYVAGTSPTNTYLIYVQGFAKQSGHVWTTPGVSYFNQGTAGGYTFFQTAAFLLNTGGGTGGKGHLVVQFNYDNYYGYHYAQYIDAGALLTTAGVSNSNLGQPGAFNSNAGFDGDVDGPSGSTGLIAGNFSASVISVQTFITSGAVPAVGTALSINPPLSISLTRLRVVRYAGNSWAIITPTTTGTFQISLVSSTAVTNPGVALNPGVYPIPSQGNASGNANSGAWDVFLDPLVPSKIWVMGPASTTQFNGTGYVPIIRWGATLGANTVTWDSAPVVDDSVANVSGFPQSFRCTRKPAGRYLDWGLTSNYSGSNYGMLADNTQFASAPSAPTLTAPAPSAYIDLTQNPNVTFTATYNSQDGTNQSAYALRVKTSGGAYSYFNATTNTLQSTILWNTISTTPGGSFSVLVPVAAFANSNTYNWSIASQETAASLQGPFATDSTFNTQTAPGLVVNAPTGTIATQQPTVTWTPTIGGSSVQTAYRVVVYSLAQYTASGFTPGGVPTSYDSGLVSSSVTTHTLTTGLVNGGTYRAYVQITVTGNQTSTWAYSGFSIQLDAPATPVMTAASGTDPSGIPAIVLTLQGNDNMLTTNQSSLETDTTGWIAGTNTTIGRSTAFALNGLASLSLTSVAAGQVAANTPTGTAGTAVSPSQTVTCLASFRAATTGRSCVVQINWYQASGAASAVRSSNLSAGVTSNTSGWTQALITVAAPSDAAFAAVTVAASGTTAAGEVHYVDQISIAPGSSTTWTRGGLVGITVAYIAYSDDGGVTYSLLRNGSALTIPVPSQKITLYDYEAVPGKARTYHGLVQATV